MSQSWYALLLRADVDRTYNLVAVRKISKLPYSYTTSIGCPSHDPVPSFGILKSLEREVITKVSRMIFKCAHTRSRAHKNRGQRQSGSSSFSDLRLRLRIFLRWIHPSTTSDMIWQSRSHTASIASGRLCMD